MNKIYLYLKFLFASLFIPFISPFKLHSSKLHIPHFTIIPPSAEEDWHMAHAFKSYRQIKLVSLIVSTTPHN